MAPKANFRAGQGQVGPGSIERLARAGFDRLSAPASTGRKFNFNRPQGRL